MVGHMYDEKKVTVSFLRCRFEAASRSKGEDGRDQLLPLKGAQ